jgi:outer membrane receptor protein involved in Fe transport
VLGPAFLLASAAVGAPGATADGGRAPSPPTDEILVTGERVERSLRQTQSSVAVFTRRELQRQPDTDRLEDLLSQVPNVQFGTGGQGPTVRGHDTTGALQDLPAFLGGTRPRVTLQIDGRAAGFNELVFGVAPLWDVRQVEVFRSPQTTTQGRNAIAGAIFIETEDPVFDWESRVRAIGGSLARQQLSGVVSGPLVKDQIAFRIAGDLRGGKSSSRLADVHQGADPNRDDFALVRLKLLGEPRALPWLRMEGSYSHTYSQMPQIEGVRAPFRQRRDPLAPYGVFKVKVNAFTASAEAELLATLRTITTLSLGESRIDRISPKGLGEARNALSDRSFETVTAWKPRESLSVSAGVHHLRTRLDQAIDLSAILGTGAFDDRQQSWGLFGEAAFTPLNKLTVIAGGRYQSDAQDRVGTLGEPTVTGAIAYRGRFSAWLPKLSIAYDLAPSGSAGFLIQRAYNPGGVTLDFDAFEQRAFGPESLWSYEFFARGTAGRRWSFGTNLFYQRLHDAQRASPRNFTLPGRGSLIWAQIRNLPSAENYGLEASAIWRPSAHVEVRGAVGLLQTRILESGGPGPDITGLEFQRSPRLTWSVQGIWTPLERLSLSAVVKHNSGYFSDDANTPARAIGPATSVDFRSAYQLGRSRIFSYARNLLNQFKMTYLFTPVFGTASDPREFGVGIETSF